MKAQEYFTRHTLRVPAGEIIIRYAGDAALLVGTADAGGAQGGAPPASAPAADAFARATSGQASDIPYRGEMEAGFG